MLHKAPSPLRNLPQSCGMLQQASARPPPLSCWKTTWHRCRSHPSWLFPGSDHVSLSQTYLVTDYVRDSFSEVDHVFVSRWSMTTSNTTLLLSAFLSANLRPPFQHLFGWLGSMIYTPNESCHIIPKGSHVAENQEASPSGHPQQIGWIAQELQRTQETSLRKQVLYGIVLRPGSQFGALTLVFKYSII